MNVHQMPKSRPGLDAFLFSLNNFMLEQIETADYKRLIETVVDPSFETF